MHPTIRRLWNHDEPDEDGDDLFISTHYYMDPQTYFGKTCSRCEKELFFIFSPEYMFPLHDGIIGNKSDKGEEEECGAVARERENGDGGEADYQPLLRQRALPSTSQSSAAAGENKNSTPHSIFTVL